MIGEPRRVSAAAREILMLDAQCLTAGGSRKRLPSPVKSDWRIGRADDCDSAAGTALIGRLHALAVTLLGLIDLLNEFVSHAAYDLVFIAAAAAGHHDQATAQNRHRQNFPEHLFYLD